MSFRLKIVLGIALVQACLLFALIYSSLDFLRASNERELQKRAFTTVSLFASSIKEAMLTTNLASLESAAAEVMNNPDIAYVRVLDTHSVLTRSGDPQALARPFVPDTGIGETSDGIFDIAGSIDIEGVNYGRVEIGMSIDAMNALLHEARTQTLSIAAAAIAVFAVVSLILGLYLTRGLQALARGTRRLAAGELGYQIEVKGSDELAVTAQAFNAMSRELQDAAAERQRNEAELAEHREHLEQLVAQRTEELTQANRELAQVHQQMLQSEKMASIGQLAAGVAHEINNPVGFINSNISALGRYMNDALAVVDAHEQARSRLGDGHGEYAAVDALMQELDFAYLKDDVVSLLGETSDGLARVKKIVQDLKDFSHVDETEWQWADLHKGLDSTLNMARNEIKYKAEVLKEYGELPAVECMPSQLNQVFMNLLVNAAHAIAERGTITLRTGSDADRVWVEIADSGCGIAPENLQRIFDPFFTTKAVGTGTGLGLSLSYGIVQKHHGQIEVESEAGQGTCFRIRLPIRQPAPTP
ncbi:MAG: ATP-binding protein [Rhodocyclaceae bacterium]